MAGILGTAEGQIRSVLKLLIEDPVLTRSITYKRWKAEVFDDGEGIVVPSFDSFQFLAARTSHSVASARVLGSEVQAGDVMFVIQESDLPAGMGLKDIIEDGSETFRIVNINDLFTFGAILTCKGL